ncbi:DNA internalization-related competence protein ComEC/Rec2 [Piscinibacter sakaiensis]|uniref:Putative hydrolase of the metallo-beta-lactamase superfamily n=1 Tax=Piscinibacter sakaiensis TaxID=1547922 RepID=A0A0K8P7B2_PISS1|nr:DNA internalization-related competence protein ComEC/Rec2 [Piscinibacter sakaiensis]GAP38512.1 putative hydrolase of the metallo-beta-lactamase superfamily [Piscinibacter sakaiensis]
MPPEPPPRAPAARAGRLAAAGLGWLLGIAALMQAPQLPTPAQAVAALGGAALLACLRPRRAPAGLVLAATAVAAALLAAAWTTALGRPRLAERLPHALEGRDLVVIGRVASLPQWGAQGLRFRFETESARRPDGTPVRLPDRLSLGWTTGWHEDAVRSGPQAGLAAGQRWCFTLRLRRPHGTLNPHGHDLELAMLEQGVGAVGHVRDGPQPPQWLADTGRDAVDRLRQRVRDAILASVPDRRAAGVLAALAIGDQSAIGREDWQLYRDTGIAHLVAISGLHVTMFAWIAGGIVAALWRRHPRAPLRWATPQAARWGGLACAVGYAVLAGWGVPAQRTALMLAVVATLAGLGRQWPWPWVLLAAAVAVTAIDPWALLQPGFWLSFVAVGLLMASGPDPATGPRDGSPAAGTHGVAGRLRAAVWRLGLRPAAGLLRAQAIATLGLAPLGLVIFQQLSVVGLFANLVAVPLVTLLVTPLALLGAAWPPLWLAAAGLLRGLGAWLQWLADWPFAVWRPGAAPLWAQALGLLGALLLVLPWPLRLRLLALPLALPMAWPAERGPPPGRFELVALDVGQGSAVLLRTRRHLLLYDAGPRHGRDSDAGQRVLLPLLQGRGERRVDRLVLSHRDQDHVGGAASLLAAWPVGELVSSLEAGHPLLAGPVPQRPCRAGEAWHWDGVDFRWLHPVDALGGAASRLSPNARSCVLHVAGRGPGAGGVLLAGDIERPQELALVARDAARLPAEVLLLPHHGSRSSSSEALLAAVAPRVAVAQAGYRNRFGHPAPEVLARLRARGIAVVETARCGAWTWQGDAAVAEAHCERERRRRHWHDTPADGS